MSLFRLKGYLYPFEQDHATGVRKTLKMLILHLFQPIQSHRQHFSTVSLATRWLSISATNSWCKSLTSITIPNGMTSVRYSAFSCCESLTSIKIPNGVTSIGKNAFYGRKSLTSITIPGSVTSIGNLNSAVFFLWDNLLCEDGYFCLICSLRCDICLYVWCMYTKFPTQANGET